MRKLALWALSGLLLLGCIGDLPGKVASQKSVPVVINRPLGPGAPASLPPYTIYLPLATRKFVPSYVSPFGIDMYGDNLSMQGQAQMQAAGSAWETVFFSWSRIEPTAPISGVQTYDWTTFDATVARAHASGMSLFVLFTGNPAWAAALPGGPVTNTADLLSVVSAAAERYDGDGDAANAPGSPVINYWSFYAEPDNGSLQQAQTNGKGFWGNDPAGYADMLAGVSTAIHAANPNAVVMNGGLAYDGFTTNVTPGPFVESFLPGVLDQLNTAHGGAPATLGAVAFHFYPINIVRWPTIKDKAQAIRLIMTAHGAGNLPLIVPEMGYWSEPVPQVPAFNSTEPKQARVLVETFVRGLSVGIRQMSWFMVFDSAPATEAHGLFRGTDLNSPKPSYTAYATLTSELYGARYLGPLSGAGIEGYVFDMGAGQQKSVVWATGPSAQIAFDLTCIRRVDYMGNVTAPIEDGSPWDQDHIAGQITLQVLQDQPIYVSGC